MMRARKSLSFVAAALVGVVVGFSFGRAAPPDRSDAGLFVMLYTPGPAWDATLPPPRQTHFDVHSRNLGRLRADSAIVAGGRFGPWGFIMVQAEDEAEARAMFAPDSSLMSGTFEGELHAWSTIYEGCVRR